MNMYPASALSARRFEVMIGHIFEECRRYGLYGLLISIMVTFWDGDTPPTRRKCVFHIVIVNPPTRGKLTMAAKYGMMCWQN
jgi:hypothetical protein